MAKNLKMKKLILFLLAIMLCLNPLYNVEVSASNSNCMSVAATESGFIDGVFSYDVYTQNYFGYYGNINCGAIAICNILSYYKQYRGYTGLYSGSTISQQEFEEIFELTDYGYSSIYDVQYAIETYCSRRGYTVNSYDYSSNLTKWSNLKSAINNNMPLICGINGHAMAVTGYLVENGVNSVYVNNMGVSSQQYEKYGWVEFPLSASAMAFNIY